MSDQAVVKVDHGVNAIEKMGEYIAKSGLFGVKNTTQAVALMLIAQAEGRHPASAAQDYHIIQNRPSLKTDTMLARFQAAGGKVEWGTYTDTKVVGKFSHPQGGTLEIGWDMDRAKRAGLGTKDNWKNYPRAMLRARVISEAIRTVYPAVLGGMYTPEEVADFEPAPPPPAKEPEAPKEPESEYDPNAAFEEMVQAKGVGEATRPMLDQFIKETSEGSGKSIVEVKQQAVQYKDRFWAGFSDWMKNLEPPEDTGDEAPMSAEEIPLEI